jgi:voltage-gated potassium channel
VTATLATYFVGRDAASNQSDIAGQQSIDALRDEIAKLRDEIRARDPGDGATLTRSTDR